MLLGPPEREIIESPARRSRAPRFNDGCPWDGRRAARGPRRASISRTSPGHRADDLVTAAQFRRREGVVPRFNEQENDVTLEQCPGGATFASINLRDLGTGNTLVLINGRRMVLNPRASNRITGSRGQFRTLMKSRRAASGGFEVLRDGASAIYGADRGCGRGQHRAARQSPRRLCRGGMARRGRHQPFTAPSSTAATASISPKDAQDLTVYGSYFHENGMPSSEPGPVFPADDNRLPLVRRAPIFRG